MDKSLSGVPRIAVHLLILILAVLLSVFGSPKRADAFAIPPVPIAVGAVLESAPAELLVVGGTAATVGTIGLGVLGAGVLLYATKDSWLPVVENVFSGGTGSANGAGVLSGTCGRVATATAGVGVPGGSISLNMVHSDCSISGVNWRINRKCYSGNVISAFSKGYAKSGISGTTTDTLACTAPFKPLSVDIYAGSGAGDEIPSKLVSRVVFDNPSDLYSSRVNMDCRLQDGSVQTITEVETGHPGRISAPSCSDRFPESWPIGLTVDTGPPGYPQRVLEVHPKPDLYQDYGDCFTELGLVCKIRVWINGEACTASEPACGDWQTYAIEHPAKVKCKFGSHVVQMSNCSPLKRSYLPTRTPQPVTSPTEWPDTGGTPGTSPGTSGFPESGTNPDTPDTLPDASTNPDTKTCFAESWSWNPISWVYTPVKCVIIWAFVPKTALATDLVQPTFGAWLPSLPEISDASCGPLSFPGLDFPLGIHTAPKTFLNTCNQPWSSSIFLVKTSIGVIVAVGGVRSAYRIVTKAFGLNAGLGSINPE